MTAPLASSIHPGARSGLPPGAPSAPPPRRHPLRRRILIVLGVLVVIVVLLMGSLSLIFSTSAGSRWAVNRLVGLTNTGSTSLTIASSEGTLLWGLQLTDVRYRSEDNHIHVESLSSRWDLLPLLYRQFNLEALHVRGLEADWAAPAETDDESDPFAFLPLPVSIRVNDVQLQAASIRYDNTAYALDTLHFSALLDGHELHVEDLALESLAVGSGQVTLHADATLELRPALPLDGVVQWEYSGPLYEDIAGASGELSARGTIDTLELEHQLTAPVRVLSSGRISTGLTDPDTGAEQPLAIDLTHTLQQETLPLAAVQDYRFEDIVLSTTGTPAEMRLAGAGVITGEALPPIDLDAVTQLRGSLLFVDEINLQSATGQLTGNGLVSWEDGLSVDFDYVLEESNPESWYSAIPEGLQLGPLSSSGNVRLRTEADILTGSASIDTFEGILNDYALTGGAELLVNGEQLTINQLMLSSSENRMSVAGTLGTALDLQFALDVPVAEHLYEGMQGSLSAQGSLTGTRSAPQLTLEALAQNLVMGSAGISRISLAGEFSSANSAMTLLLEDASLGVEQNSLQVEQFDAELSGRPDEHRLQMSVLSSYGSAELQLAGALREQIPGERSWEGDLERGAFDTLAGAWRLQQPVQLLLSAQQVSVSRHCWQQQLGPEGSLCLEGEWSPQQIDALAELQDIPLGIINHPEAVQAIAAVSPAMAPESFPDLQLPYQLPQNLAIEGSLNGTIQISGAITDNPEDLEVHAFLGTGAGELIARFEQTVEMDPDASGAEPLVRLERFTWPAITLQAQLERNVLNASGNLEFLQRNEDGTGGMQGSASANVELDAARNLGGRVDIAFDDLRFIEAFLPQLQETRGSLNSSLRLSGTLEQPQISGNARLADARTDIPELGLQLRDMEALLRSEDGETLQFSAEAASGNGSLQIESTLRDALSERREIALTLAGSDFQVLNLPQLLASISPDLNLQMDSSGIVVSGNLLIPQLNIEIESLPESAVNVSGDAVIVGQPIDGEEVRNAALGDRGILGDTPISGTIQLQLGEDVRFSGFGLTAQIDGALDINQRPSGSPLTYGELSIVEGSYTTYGQTLTIEHGKLLFFGTYDNPGLDIRAVREAENVKVGVQMNGTLRNIESELFSTPPLPDGEIIAVLVTGRPLSEIGDQDGNALVGAITTLGINQGQSLTNQIRNQLGLDTLTISSRGDTSDSSVMLGKYLTPRIFIRYAVGLFETQSELAIEYSISDRVKLEATSGQDQTIDLTYTRER